MLDIHDYANIVDTVGALMVAYAALRVHHRVLNEHRIDKAVYMIMRVEQKVGVTGVILIIIGTVMDILA